MKRDYIAKLNAWYHEEVDALKAKGATEALFVEPVVRANGYEEAFGKPLRRNRCRSAISGGGVFPSDG